MQTSAPSRSADVAAFEAAAALDMYEEEMECVSLGIEDPGRLARAGAELSRVCQCCARLPQLSVGSVTLLLSHFRLLAALPAGAASGSASMWTQLARAHQRSIDALRRQCREHFLSARLQ